MDDDGEDSGAEIVTLPKRRPSRAERIAQLRAQADALEAKDKTEARRLDARRKIIVGGMVIAAMQQGDFELSSLVRGLLKSRVTRASDRKAIADLLQ